MTRTTNARLAGFTFLFYIAIALPATILSNNATRGRDTAAKLAGIAQHASDIRVAVVLSLLAGFAAFVLAVALYGITRDEDHELAVLALCCRAGEGVANAIFVVPAMGLLWLATAGVGAQDAAAAAMLGGLLLKAQDWGTMISATLFAVGSTLFSYLLLRGRTVPVPLAWLGVLASVVLVIVLPARLVGLARGPITLVVWLPALVFEVALALWLLIKGVPEPARR
jgi:hypothetical protein